MSRKSGGRENEGNADMHADALATWCRNKPNLLVTIPNRILGTVDLARYGGSHAIGRRKSRFSTYTSLYFNFYSEHHFIGVRYCTFRVKMRFALLGIIPGMHSMRCSLSLCVYKSAIPFLLCQYQNPSHAQVYSA